jgi:hypothetical protein
VWNYGIRAGNKKDQYYEDQSHQYLRFGVKRYFSPKFNTGYIMPEVGFFHFSHKGTFKNVAWNENPSKILQADANLHDYYLKTGLQIGRKMKAGPFRFDIFTGGGARFTFRKYKLNEILNPEKDWIPNERHMMFSHKEVIYLHKPEGWTSKKPEWYISLGIRLGIGFKPVVLPKS